MIDASAILAIVLDEPERHVFNVALERSTSALVISPVNMWEVETRLDGIGDERRRNAFVMLCGAVGLQISTVDAAQTGIAVDARRKYGKGNHPAALNMGDCFAYALAKSRGEPLLFKGDDFRLTDVKAAL